MSPIDSRSELRLSTWDRSQLEHLLWVNTRSFAQGDIAEQVRLHSAVPHPAGRFKNLLPLLQEELMLLLLLELLLLELLLLELLLELLHYLRQLRI